MPLAKMERVAVGVSDVKKTAADLKAIFDMDLTIVDVPQMGFLVGLGDDGVELVQLHEGRETPAVWRGALGALCFACDDLDAVSARVEGLGFHKQHEVTLGGGLREILFPDFNGLPLVLCSRTPEGMVRAIMGDSDTITMTVAGGPHV